MNARFFALSLLFATAALAQSTAEVSEPAPSWSEFGRGSGGVINSITKHGQPLSGSLGFFGSGNRGKAYGATIGGALVKDRMWFFASGEEQTVARPSGVTVSALPTARQSLLASFAATGPEASVQRTFAPTTPSSFLNLHYTGILSSNMFVTASVSQQRANPPN